MNKEKFLNSILIFIRKITKILYFFKLRDVYNVINKI